MTYPRVPQGGLRLHFEEIATWLANDRREDTDTDDSETLRERVCRVIEADRELCDALDN